MTVDLTHPLRWRSADSATKHLLATLQGNVLKSHGRDFATHLFFRLGNGRIASGRALRDVALLATSAARQLVEIDAYRRGIPATKPFVGVCLSHRGYVNLGRKSDAPVGEPCFVRGMGDPASLKAVGDSLSTWEDEYRQPLDGLVIVADDDPAALRRCRDAVVERLESGRAIVAREQAGAVLRNDKNESIEHFGYRDSLSQPTFLSEELERGPGGAHERWNSAAPLANVLVFERANRRECGSYLVFRKLEQDVAGFEGAVERVAAATGLSGTFGRDLAGAFVVGRFKDGTPVTASDRPVGGANLNDFNYGRDDGIRCPFHAHIRKLNPRGSSRSGLAGERQHLMPRRGISYEEAPPTINRVPGRGSASAYAGNAEQAGRTKKGLLFMAYNSSLQDQFVLAQSEWANNRRYPERTAGSDPLIGQGPSGLPLQRWKSRWNDPAAPARPLDFGRYVTMRGGEYFFAPSLTFLGSL